MAEELSTLDEALIEAISKGDYDNVVSCLERGANIEARDKCGYPALHNAVLHTDIVRLLLDKGANINARSTLGKTALHWAAIHRRSATVRLLLEKGAAHVQNLGDGGYTPLHDAVRFGRLDNVLTLLKHGINPNTQDRSGQTPLHRATQFNMHAGIALALLEHGADPNARDKMDKTPFHNATEGNAALQLLEYGADINAADRGGKTLLHYAASKGNTDTALTLLKRGADINAVDKEGKTPFISIRNKHYTDCALVLLDHGAIPSRHRGKKVIPDLYNIQEMLEKKFPGTLANPPLEEKSDEATAKRSFLARVCLLARELAGDTDPAPWHEKLVRNALRHQEQSSKPFSWKALAAPTLHDTAANCENVHDMVSEFAECILLPALLHPLLEEGGKNTVANASYLRKLPTGKLRKRLLPVAADALLSELPPHHIVALSRAWHHRPNILPHDVLRPLAGGQWHALTGDVKVPDNIAKGWTLHCLNDSKSLQAEGKRMKHCAGTYSPRCRNGEYHVYALRDGKDNPVTTIGLDSNLELGQNLGYHDAEPSEEARAAGEWFAQELKATIPVNSQRGETEESKRSNTAPSIIKTIGYWPTTEAMANVFRHYTSDKMRAIVWNEDQKKFVSREPRLVYQQQEQRNPAREERKLADLQRTDKNWADWVHQQPTRKAPIHYTPYSGNLARGSSRAMEAEDSGLALWLKASGAEDALEKIRATMPSPPHQARTR